MKLTNKLNVTLIMVVVFLVLAIGASYAWLTMATSPEVQKIETNVGANGSLEIALLNQETFQDPTLIKTAIGDSAATQNFLESNETWGNVIELQYDYGLDQISLLPARLNVTRNEDVLTVNRNMLKIADYGIDGRIKILGADTVSAVKDSDDFNYYVDGQSYGVHAIGTISNITTQQKTLATTRTLYKSYSAAAARTTQNTWRDYGGGIMDILYRHYALGENAFTAEDAEVVRHFSDGIYQATLYADGAMRQAIIGLAASYIVDEPDFEFLCSVINSEDNRYSLADCLNMMYIGEVGSGLNEKAQFVDEMIEKAESTQVKALALAYQCNWKNIESVLYPLMDLDTIYLGEKKLTDPDGFRDITHDNVLLLPKDSGVMADMARLTGNYSAFTMWKGNISVELQTAMWEEAPLLPSLQVILDQIKAATGGWTRTKLDDLYAFAVDLAFRCNQPSDLLLQTEAEMRVEDDSEFPVTYGNGSYMQFYSENMDMEQLINLMDTLRVGFISDRNELLAVAKLGDYWAYENTAGGWLHLYDFELEDSGKITIIQRKYDAAILELPQNSPVVLTVVVWMDGDHVDNSMVGELTHYSMSGNLNLQFSSSADLIPSQQIIEKD